MPLEGFALDPALIQKNKDAMLDAIGGGIGVGGITVGWLADVSEVAQALSVIFGCIVVFITLCHTAHRYWRFIKTKSSP